MSDIAEKAADAIVIGTDHMQLLCKASSKSEGWVKSIRAMHVPGLGCVVQMTTQHLDHVAEAAVFVPGAIVVDDVNDGKKLAAG